MKANRYDSSVKLREILMGEYTFYINGEYKTVEADYFEGALRQAGIEEGEEYNLVELIVLTTNALRRHYT